MTRPVESAGRFAGRRDPSPEDSPARPASRLRWPVWASIVLAVAARAVLITGYIGWSAPPGSDGADYDALAMNLVDGRGYAVFPDRPSAWRPPAYPAFLAAVYAVAGHKYAVVRGIHCLLGGVLSLLMFLLGRALADERVGIWAALISAVYPLFVALSGFIYTETLYLPCVVGVALLFVWLQRRPALVRAFVVGAAAGLTALIRPNLLMLPILGGLALWAAGLPLRRASVMAAGMLVGAGLVVGPWTVRNQVALGQFVPISTNGGITLFIGNNHRASGGGGVEWAVVGYPWEEAVREYAVLGVEPPRGNFPSGINYWEDLSEVENDRRYRELAESWVRQHPGQALRLIPKKLAKFWSWRITSSRPYTVKYAWVSLLSYGPVLLFAALGLGLSLRKWRRWIVVYVMAIPYIVSACIFYGSARLRLPVDCFLIVMAAYAVVRACDWWRQRRDLDAEREGD